MEFGLSIAKAYKLLMYQLPGDEGTDWSNTMIKQEVAMFAKGLVFPSVQEVLKTAQD